MKLSTCTKVFLASAIILVMCELCIAQPSQVGIYITVKTKKKCNNEVLTADSKKICLAPLPVLTSKDILYLTDMKVDLANQKYFNLVFTEAGAVKLKNLSIAYPNTEIVLVIDKLIVGYLTNLQFFKSNVLRMSYDDGDGDDIDMVHERLKNIITVRN